MTEPELPELLCRHLILCRTIWYDAGNPDDGYSLGRVLIHVRPSDEQGFGFVAPRLFLYAELQGTPGEYQVRVRMVRIIATEDGEEVEADHEPIEWSPRGVAVPGDNFAEAFGFPLVRVPFGEPGVYEFQLWADGFDEPIGRERIEARE